MTTQQLKAALAVKAVTDLRTGERLTQTVQVTHRDPKGRIRTINRRT